MRGADTNEWKKGADGPMLVIMDRLSLDQTDDLFPDHHYGSTADSLHAYGRESDEPCFELARIDPSRVDPFQLIDDPDDDSGMAKVEDMRRGLRSGDSLPPVYVQHRPSAAHPYFLFEGRHRFNAAHAEGVLLLAWVAHIDCCEVADSEPIDG